MTSFSKVLIAALIAATSVTATVAARSIANGKVAHAERAAERANVTIIYKSDVHWPVKGRVSVDPCNLYACVEA